jgi:NADH-quinone oxidoreductase E subunit
MNVRVTETNGFAFTDANKALAEAHLAKYPKDRKASAVMPLLTIAQEQNDGWLSVPCIEHVAGYLSMPPIRVHEVASFYTMYHLRPVGKHVIEVCTTTPCWLRGSNEIIEVCEEALGIKVGETTADGKFTLLEVECAGACVNAPVCAIHKQYYEDLDVKSMAKIIKALKTGKKPKAGPQIKRQTSAPSSGLTTLTDVAEAAGKGA